MLVKRSIVIGIVLFWGLMNIWFVKRQLWAPPPPIALRSTEKITESSEESWGIFYRGDKIGYATQTITPDPQGYRVIDHSVLRLQLLGTTQNAATRLHMDADLEWALRRFDFELQSDEIRFIARGQVSPGKLKFEVESAGNITKREISLGQTPYLLTALKPYVVTQQLEPGKEHYFSTFDPATLSQQMTSVIIEGREYIRVGDRTEPAIRLRQRFKGLSVVSWVDGLGRTLKEESPAGLSLVRQTPQEARRLSAAHSVSLDLIAQSSITPTGSIPQPERIQKLKLRLDGIDLANFPLATVGRQRLHEDQLEIQREATSRIVSFPLPLRDWRFGSFIQPTPFMQSDHPRIRAVAHKILGGERDAHTAVRRIKDWVYSEIAKQPTVSIPSALEVLETKKGDCNEHTVLFNALARAAGIPAKTVVGLVYLRGAFYYHAWSEVWLGQWISLDPVLNQFPADATHVKFIEGDIDRQIDILQLIGNLKIQVIEAS
jgi:transglutaminase-like putative cysteine protease